MADRRLQVFFTVGRLLSFTKAAESLHMTQPAVTFQVRQLEEYFNTRLFDRTHNKITLTEAGNHVYKYAEQIFSLYSEMENGVRNITGEVSGVLLLGASTTIAEYMLPALLGNFKKIYPEVTIRLKVSNSDGVVEMVENNEIDLGVVEAPVSNKNLVVERCTADKMVVVVPPGHKLSTRRTLSIEEVAKHPYICREEGSGTREVMLEALNEKMREDLNIVMELGSPEAVKGAVEAGMGVTIISRSTIEKELRLGTLVAIELKQPIERAFSFVHQKQKFKLRAMDKLLEFVKEYCRKHATGEHYGC